MCKPSRHETERENPKNIIYVQEDEICQGQTPPHLHAGYCYSVSLSEYVLIYYRVDVAGTDLIAQLHYLCGYINDIMKRKNKLCNEDITIG